MLLYHQCSAEKDLQRAPDESTERANGYRCILAANLDGWMHRDTSFMRWLGSEGQHNVLAALDESKGTFLGTNKSTGKFAVLTYHRSTAEHFGAIVPDLVFYCVALCGLISTVAGFHRGHFTGGKHSMLEGLVRGGINMRIIWFLLAWTVAAYAGAKTFARRSRGMLPMKFLSDEECTAGEFARRITGSRLHRRYGGFHMVVGDVDGEVW